MSPRGRLLLLTLLFLAWIGYLGYLVSQTRDTIVLSRPQFLVSNRVALVRLTEKNGTPSPEAEIVETLKPQKDGDLPKALTLSELPYIDARHGWRGPGEYLIPLTSLVGANMHITPIPMSPGFPPAKNRLASVELTAAKAPAEMVMKFAGWSQEEYDRRIKKLPTLVKANAPLEQAIAFAKEAGKESVRLTEAEVRIYFATPEVRRQFATMEQ